MKEWLSASLLSLLFWGLWAFLPRLASGYMEPKTLTLFQAIGIMIVALTLWSFGSEKTNVQPMGVAIGIISGGVGILGTYFYNVAMRKGSAPVVLSITALYPLFTLILLFLFFREIITIKQGVGIGFALTAMVLLAH